MRFLFFLLASIGIVSNCYAEWNMNQIDKKYSIIKNQCIIETMPKTRNQGGLSICYAAVAATLLDEFKCYEKNNQNCTSVPNADKFSMIDLARFSQTISDQDDRRDREKYEGIPQRGSVYSVLLSAWYADSAVSLDCVPSNAHFLNGVSPDVAGAFDGGIQGVLWGKLRGFHEMLGGTRVTPEQAMVLKRDFILQPDIETIQTAFSQTTWSLALDKLLVPKKCAEDWMDQLSVSGRMDKPKFWPNNEDHEKGKRPTYAEVINQIKHVIANLKRPLALNFCAVLKSEFKSTEQCASAELTHSVVIEGYRQMCDRSGSCLDSLKVRNSWGDQWQEANNDGWIDAKTLLNATFYDNQFLTWLEKKPPVHY